MICKVYLGDVRETGDLRCFPDLLAHDLISSLFFPYSSPGCGGRGRRSSDQRTCLPLTIISQ